MPCICSLRFECLTWSELVLCCRPDGESDGTQLNGEKEGESRKGELLADKLPNPHSESRQTFAWNKNCAKILTFSISINCSYYCLKLKGYLRRFYLVRSRSRVSLRQALFFYSFLHSNLLPFKFRTLKCFLELFTVIVSYN